jgi:hypothetical protein
VKGLNEKMQDFKILHLLLSEFGIRIEILDDGAILLHFMIVHKAGIL